VVVVVVVVVVVEGNAADGIPGALISFGFSLCCHRVRARFACFSEKFRASFSVYSTRFAVRFPSSVRQILPLAMSRSLMALQVRGLIRMLLDTKASSSGTAPSRL